MPGPGSRGSGRYGSTLDANWRSAYLKTLVEQTLAAYRVDHPEVVEVEVEPVALTPQQGLGFSLVLHELGTNAAEYGALSQHEGRLRVSWHVEQASDRRIRLKWEEQHGPRVKPPTEKGFGLQLIERAASYELDGAAAVTGRSGRARRRRAASAPGGSLRRARAGYAARGCTRDAVPGRLEAQRP
jgi:two-component sensor histidine kinase